LVAATPGHAAAAAAAAAALAAADDWVQVVQPHHCQLLQDLLLALL
jgi:hypothetical protein